MKKKNPTKRRWNKRWKRIWKQVERNLDKYGINPSDREIGYTVMEIMEENEPPKK